MTRRVGAVLASAAIVALVFGVAAGAKPSKTFTRPCELSGEAGGEGEVGVKAWSYGPLTMTVQGGGLQALFLEGLGSYGTYAGPGRVLDTRLDLYFDDDGASCQPEDCDYRLILLNGVYDQQAETVTFSSPVTEALLVDYTVPDPYTMCEGTADLVVQFTDGDGGGDTTEQCKDKKDNDGDGLVDCDDPDCNGTRWCP